jgi:integrase
LTDSSWGEETEVVAKATRQQFTAAYKRRVLGAPVRDRTVQYDLIGLQLALNWAVRERTSGGRRLLRENPLHGVRLPREKNPRQPVMTHDVYLRLLEVADRVHPLLTLALVVAEGTERRISAWENLRWDDVDFAAGTIRWRAEHDKKGYEQVVPMSDAVKEALLDARRAQKTIGNAPVFPAPKNPAVPCDRHLLDNWLRRCFPVAGVEMEKGGLWHTLRRKWATERKGYPGRTSRPRAAGRTWRRSSRAISRRIRTRCGRSCCTQRSGWRVGELTTRNTTRNRWGSGKRKPHSRSHCEA